MDESRGGIEADRQPLLAGRETEPEANVGLAGAAVADRNYLIVLDWDTRSASKLIPRLFTLETRDLKLLRPYLSLAGERMLRIVRKGPHPVTQLRWMHLQVLRCSRIRDPAIPDQTHSLKLEIPRKPSLSMTHLRSHQNT